MNYLLLEIENPKLKKLLPIALYYAIPLFSTGVFYAAFYLFCYLKYDISITRWWIPLDFELQLLIGYALFGISRKTWIFLILQAVLMGTLYVGNAVHLSFFGGPIMPDDIFALPTLLMILKGWRFYAALTPLVMIVGLLIFNFNGRHWTAYAALAFVVASSAALAYKPNRILDPIDRRTGHSFWNHKLNYLGHGATLFTLQEVARYFATKEVIPEINSAQAAVKNLLNPKPGNPSATTESHFKPRNVHIVLLESFWDPNTLKKARFNQNPLSPDFLALWQSTGFATALSPVFGRFTANSEFEVLCGFPVIKNTAKFERHLLNSAPCLPRILANNGYATYASHPNVPVFWNRVNAYRRLGFETYWSKNDFNLDDMNRDMLSDASLYRQVLERIAPNQGNKPVLDYIVTFFGHWDYPLSQSRPPQITSQSKVDNVTAYANTIYYKSREAVEFVAAVQKRDPDGIIIMFGDHLPILGKNAGGFVESEVLTSDRGNYTPEMFKFHVTTPMIIIDGKNGPLKSGSLPLFQIPKLILKLLGYDKPTIMDYTQFDPDMTIRPLPGIHFNILANGKIDVCKEPPYSASCQKSSKWLDDVTTVSNDLFIGQQFTNLKQ